MLDIDDEQRVRTLTLNRPEALNAFNDALYRAAGDALRDAAARDDIACVVITGNGRAFSAGQDLGEMRAIDPGAGAGEREARAEHGFPNFLDTLAAFPKPVLAAVNGLGVGIGLTMLLHCDIVVMSDAARLRAPFVPLGVAPEAASSLMLPAVMGNQHAAVALYTGEWISAEEAVATGIAWKCVPADRLMPETHDLARRIATMPVASLTETKRLVVASRIDAIRIARQREDEVFARMVGAPANLEAITAFMEKRAPDFSHL